MNLPGIAKKPLIKKFLLWDTGLLTLSGVLGFLVAPYFIKPALEKSISEKFHRTATIRELGINPYALSVTIKGFALKEKNGAGNALTFDELYVDVERIVAAPRACDWQNQAGRAAFEGGAQCGSELQLHRRHRRTHQPAC